MSVPDPELLQQLLRLINPSPDETGGPFQKKPSCLTALSDDQVWAVWEFHAQGYKAWRIAHIVRDVWGVCRDVNIAAVNMALRRLFARMPAPAYRPEAESSPSGVEPWKPPKRMSLRAPVAKEKHDPLVGMLELIEVQRNRIEIFRKKEARDGIPLLEVNKMVDSCRQLEDAFFKAAVETGLIQTREKESAPEKALKGVHIFLQQNISDASNVGKLMTKMAENLGRFALPAAEKVIDIESSTSSASTVREGALADAEVQSRTAAE